MWYNALKSSSTSSDKFTIEYETAFQICTNPEQIYLDELT